jgi:hypothetical protein
MSQNITLLLDKLSVLFAELQALAAPYDAQIHALEIAKADATAALVFQIDTLKATLAPLLLAQGQTVKHDGLTATVVRKETWDNALLRTFAEEVPAVLQCLRDSSYVTFRHHPRR